MPHTVFLAALAAGVVLVCAPRVLSAQQTSEARSFDVITAEQVDRALVKNAYDAVEKLRPGFLRRAERPRTIVGNRKGQPEVAPVGRGRDTERMFATDRSSMDAGGGDVGRSGAMTVMVYVDGTRVGGVQELKRIPSQDVREIRFLSASDAQARYGTGHAAGVIQVSLKTS
ncbi:MAG TPA: TonB-dependent receptor plug domain-containing protein [Gemmatimonadales bacterium]|jgi:hypothetical protein|nr:TonB-dependent receptor plug domain-containing protein [Gemmatimonadales bacterium]